MVSNHSLQNLNSFINTGNRATFMFNVSAKTNEFSCDSFLDIKPTRFSSFQFKEITQYPPHLSGFLMASD